jgi:hypothetical protein
MGRGAHRKYVPWVFTEHGALMAASVLNSPRAVQMSLYVVRAFLRLREWVAGQAQLAAKLANLERRVAGHDEELIAIVQANPALDDAAGGTASQDRVRQRGLPVGRAAGVPARRAAIE